MKFYIIDRSDRFNDKTYAYGEQIDAKTGEFEKCEECGLPVGKREWLSPRKVKLSKNSCGDFVYGTFPTFLCSEKFKQAYESEELKGIVEFQEINIMKINRSKSKLSNPSKYYNVKILRSSVHVNESLSNLIREEKTVCRKCRIGIITSLDGVFIEKKSWKGEDIFYAVGLPGIIIVSERFRDFVIKNKFTNIKFIPAEHYKPIWIL